MKDNTKFFLMAGLGCLLCIGKVGPIYAQQAKELPTISLGMLKEDNIHEVQGSAFLLSYNLNTEGEPIHFILTGRNNERVFDTWLNGTVGRHEEEINLEGRLSANNANAIYFAEWSSKAKKYEARLQFNPIPNTPLPIAAVSYKPIKIDCDPFMPSVVEYTGTASGGTPPYKGNWYISESPSIKDLKYAPKSFELKTTSDESFISVESSLGYYITLLIEDNCKKISKRVYKVNCDERDGKVIIELQPLQPEDIGGDYR